MLRRLPLLLCVPACALALAVPAAGHGLLVGAAEDAPKQPDLVSAVAKLELAQLAGLRAIRVTSLWSPGRVRPSESEATALRNAAAAAQLTGIRLYVAVYPSRGRLAPLTPSARADFSAYAVAVASDLLAYGVTDYVVGNEPNLSRFWAPQFDRKGQDASAPAYFALLARTYDALQAVSPAITVIGGALAPRGKDQPGAPSQAHSPAAFIAGLGAAYRKSRRERPIMDVFSFHPYLESSKLPPTFRHPRSTSISLNDFDKLVAALGTAFTGTPLDGTKLPILYDEFGVQSRITRAKARYYTNRHAPAAADAVSEAVQASYYRQALELASCQRRVVGLFLFHVTDERDLRAWQSGLYYADDAPKSSLAAFRAAALQAEDGSIARCTAGNGGQ